MKNNKKIRWDKKSYINFVTKLHNSKYDYSKLTYTKLHDNVIIICLLHGEFKQSANHHKRGSGCPKCAIEKQKEKQKDNTESFVKKAQLIHSYKYDYSQTIYGKNAQDKVKIICPYHGLFEQSPNAHLRNGGCKLCGQEKSVKKLKEKGFHSWSKSNWRKRCKGRVPKLYVIRLFNKEESFYKIGITSKDLIKRRFTKIPYDYEIIKIVEGKPDYIFDLERRFLSLTKNKKYIPKIKFEGYTECRKV